MDSSTPTVNSGTRAFSGSSSNRNYQNDVRDQAPVQPNNYQYFDSGSFQDQDALFLDPQVPVPVAQWTGYDHPLEDTPETYQQNSGSFQGQAALAAVLPHHPVPYRHNAGSYNSQALASDSYAWHNANYQQRTGSFEPQPAETTSLPWQNATYQHPNAGSYNPQVAPVTSLPWQNATYQLQNAGSYNPQATSADPASVATLSPFALPVNYQQQPGSAPFPAPAGQALQPAMPFANYQHGMVPQQEQGTQFPEAPRRPTTNKAKVLPSTFVMSRHRGGPTEPTEKVPYKDANGGIKAGSHPLANADGAPPRQRKDKQPRGEGPEGVARSRTSGEARGRGQRSARGSGQRSAAALAQLEAAVEAASAPAVEPQVQPAVQAQPEPAPEAQLQLDPEAESDRADDYKLLLALDSDPDFTVDPAVMAQFAPRTTGPAEHQAWDRPMVPVQAQEAPSVPQAGTDFVYPSGSLDSSSTTSFDQLQGEAVDYDNGYYMSGALPALDEAGSTWQPDPTTQPGTEGYGQPQVEQPGSSWSLEPTSQPEISDSGNSPIEAADSSSKEWEHYPEDDYPTGPDGMASLEELDELFSG
ncbi:hypothetical protein KVT40_000758 [Elsinoe batatas]|uniref:Uncharacterized protein n=1 Tax=Elsinoe batatas TaxID=2601811 RepID=A0A8K0PLE9_9PEZI|nr:hypothetical protein KVT40_000758 [Elsinoe batatas]